MALFFFFFAFLWALKLLFRNYYYMSHHSDISQRDSMLFWLDSLSDGLILQKERKFHLSAY